MPSKSESQRKAAGVALAAKRGDKDPEELTGAAKDMYESMSKSELEEFAGSVKKSASEIVQQRLYKIAEGEDDSYLPDPLNWGDLFMPPRRLAKKKEIGTTYEQITRNKAPYAFRKPLRRESQAQIPASMIGAGLGGIGGALAGEAVLGDQSGAVFGSIPGGMLGVLAANLLTNVGQLKLHKDKGDKLIEKIKEARSEQDKQEREGIREIANEEFNKVFNDKVKNWKLLDYLGGISGSSGDIEALARLSGRKLKPGTEKTLGTLIGAIADQQGNLNPNDVTLIRDKLEKRYTDPE